MNKLKGICAKVVCDQEEEGTDDCGRLKKVVEEGGKATKLKKNVKYTEWKATAQPARAWRKQPLHLKKIRGRSLVPQEKNSSVL